MFINYNKLTNGLSINTYRLPSAIACDDVSDFINERQKGHSATCSLEGVKDTLEDGAFWNGSDVTPEELECIHALICEHEAGEQEYNL